MPAPLAPPHHASSPSHEHHAPTHRTGSSLVSLGTTLLATGLGVGYIRILPGTLGALWGLPLAWLLAMLPHWSGEVVALATLWLLGVFICGSAARRLGGGDPGAVVFDELATLPLVYFPCDASLLSNPWFLATGFILHRLLDIAKPVPIRQVETLPGGWGIMADDVMAALYAWSAMYLVRLSGYWAIAGG